MTTENPGLLPSRSHIPQTRAESGTTTPGKVVHQSTWSRLRGTVSSPGVDEHTDISKSGIVHETYIDIRYTTFAYVRILQVLSTLAQCLLTLTAGLNTLHTQQTCPHKISNA